MLLSLLYSHKLDVNESFSGQLSLGGSPHMGLLESNPGGLRVGSPGGKRWNLYHNFNSYLACYQNAGQATMSKEGLKISAYFNLLDVL